MLALLPLLIQLAGQFGPSLTGMLLGQQAASVATTVVKVAKEVFGTDDPSGIATAAAANPDLTALYIERVKAETEQFRASLADVEDARKQTVQLVQSGSVIAWGAPTVSVVATVGFLAAVLVWMVHPPSSDSGAIQVLTILVGGLSAGFTQVIAYWLGSSAGSKDKDAALSAALVSSQANARVAMNAVGKPLK